VDPLEEEARRLMDALDEMIQEAADLDEWCARVMRSLHGLHWLAFTQAMEACARSEPELMHEALGMHRAALWLRGVLRD
jgi:hypothetical protein